MNNDLKYFITIDCIELQRPLKNGASTIFFWNQMARKVYTTDEITAAVRLVKEGQSVAAVCKARKISRSSLYRYLDDADSDHCVQVRGRGPTPVLPPQAESRLRDWVVGMQHDGHPVGRREVMTRVHLICALLNVPPLTDGWYDRFIGRFPELTVRQAQPIAKSRNQVDSQVIWDYFWRLSRHVICDGLDPSRIFNMDETGFMAASKKNRRVIAVKGSTNVWSKTLTASFHLTVIACGSASGWLLPPSFIIQGKVVPTEILDTLPNTRVSATESGFMNSTLFVCWLKWFAKMVPRDVKRPLQLVLDGCSSHLGEDVSNTAMAEHIILVPLPANATHLLQPLDVSVFGPYKKQISKELQDHKYDKTTITKSHAVQLGHRAWMSCKASANIVSGFATCGIAPLSYAAMEKKFLTFKTNGTRAMLAAEWLQRRAEVESTILVLPPVQSTSKRKRKTVDVENRFLSSEELHKEAAVPRPRNKAKTARRQSNTRSKRATATATNDFPTEVWV
jgi:hypothetical protein